ncbi:hypothetical protein pipiens_013433 [Culex pipiens pipiens]|uniref:Uncharacterized protein n=1 Tax=Culex pipiens pipiens TaxID=38569 RepID=A0ABD1CEC2_CULPP
MVKKLRRNRVAKDNPIDEKYVDLVDHHCPSFLRPPLVVGNKSDAPDWCFLPKAHVHLDRLHQDISDIRTYSSHQPAVRNMSIKNCGVGHPQW